MAVDVALPWVGLSGCYMGFSPNLTFAQFLGKNDVFWAKMRFVFRDPAHSDIVCVFFLGRIDGSRTLRAQRAMFSMSNKKSTA